MNGSNFVISHQYVNKRCLICTCFQIFSKIFNNNPEKCSTRCNSINVAPINNFLYDKYFIISSFNYMFCLFLIHTLNFMLLRCYLLFRPQTL